MDTLDRDAAPLVHLLPPERSSAGEARRLAGELGARLMSADQLYNLELAVTEVVSNAVRHSRSDEDVHVVMTPKEDHLCVRVTDSGLGLVPRPGAMVSDESAGFGLFIVEQLTRRWGMTREGGRTRIWFELDYVGPDETSSVAA